MEKKNKGFFATIGGWFRRLFHGGSKTLADDMEKKKKDIYTEEVVSPLKQIVRGFFERRLAVIALCIVVVMMLVVFIGPLFMPQYEDTYKETTQINTQPSLSLMSMPNELAKDIKMIDSYGTFSVGLSNAGKVYVWGATQIGATGKDAADIPQEVRDAKIAYVAAGIDHAIAIGEDGKLYAWGMNNMAQFGYYKNSDEEDDTLLTLPDEILQNGFDVANIKKVTAGYQCTAVLMQDGTLYIWGNKKTYDNIDSFAIEDESGTLVTKDDLVDIDFMLNKIVGLTKQGGAVFSGRRDLFNAFSTNLDMNRAETKDFLNGRKMIAIYATEHNLCVMLDDNSLAFTGQITTAVEPLPTLAQGEHFVQVSAGALHYTGLTNQGRVFSWGGNVFGQSDEDSDANGAAQVYACAFQNYAVDENGKLLSKWGLKGYIFGTDKYGADIFQRIIQGGKMTMTIGAVAVIISTIIGIIIGCLSGYFGGKVDLLLMRITEIFSAIPFLPFAMILSALMAQMDVSESEKIFLLMGILGVLSWTGLARLVRGQVLVTRESEYVTAAKAIGVKESRIAFRHILPNVVSVIFVTLTLDFATCMLTESSLSYLGFGVNYPRPTWGNMLNGANNSTVISNFWWQWLFTSIFLAITCICINIVGDTLRDVMDPKSDRDK